MRARQPVGVSWSSCRVSSASSSTATLLRDAYVYGPGPSTGSGATSPRSASCQKASCAPSSSDRACFWSRRAQDRNDVVFAGSTGARADWSWRYAVSRSSTRMRHDTASTTRWWMMSSRRCGSPAPKWNSATRTSGGVARAKSAWRRAASRSIAAGRASGGSMDRSTWRSTGGASTGAMPSWRHVPSSAWT
nr:hypothetical protein [Corallococcus sp. CA049B]